MGATVTTGKRAASFISAKGTQYFVLFEECFESNCYPHQPRWGCIGLGPINSAVERFFRHAAACEGGSLQGRSGLITPEYYLSSWMKEIASPVLMPDQGIEIKVGNGFYDPIQTDKMEKATEVLVSLGRQDLVDRLAAGETVGLSLYQDAELIEALYTKAAISIWRLIRPSMVHGAIERKPELGYAPPSVKEAQVVPPAVLRVDAENRLLQRPDGTWYSAGWAYSVIQDFICGLWQTEMREPGNYRKRIKAYRDAVEKATAVPAGTKVVVRLVDCPDKWALDQAHRLAECYPVTTTAQGFEAALSEENLYDMTKLDPACATWVIPTEESRADASLMQLQLL